MKKCALLIIALSSILLNACTAHVEPLNPNWEAVANTRPKSILVLPVKNNSLNVEAPSTVLAMTPIPVASRGYYVFPVNTSKVIFEHEGLYEPEMVHKQSPKKLAELFGADSILYITIERWDARYMVLNTVVTVELTYRLVNKNGKELWHNKRKIKYSPEPPDTDDKTKKYINMAIKSAATRAAPDYVPLVREANDAAFATLPKAYYYLQTEKVVRFRRKKKA